MSLLPTAHAGQSYGSRRIDFFTVSGQVSASDANTGRVTDPDGLEHDVKLIEQSSAFAPGDSATILRVQSGPNRRSRPVAIVNHSRGVWMRAAPDATSILARSGVTRSFNWWLSILAMVLTAAVAAWPTLHIFLSEINAGMMAGIPAFNIYDEILASAPGLADWRLETALPTGIADAIAGLGFIAMDQLTELSVFALAALLAILAFASRSWRLLYMPAFAAFTLIAGAMFGAAETSLIILAGGLALYLAGGLVNRIRDSGRLNSRVERLAEHVLRHPPQEEVRSADLTASAAVTVGAAAAAGIIATDAEARAPETAEAEADSTEAVADAISEAPADSDAIEAEIDGELEAIVEAESLDAAALLDDAPEAAEADAVDAEIAAVVEAAEGDTDAGDTVADEQDDSPVAPAVARDETAPETDATVADATDADDAIAAAPVADVAAQDDAASEVTETVETADADPVDDDLPSLEAVAEAAALNASEQAVADAEPAVAIDLEDESTMPVAPPPPMPSAEDASANADISEDAPQGEQDLAFVVSDEASAEAGAPPVERDAADAGMADAAEAAEAQDAQPAATLAADDLPPPVDDPVFDDADDPMTTSAVDGDFAPGTPDIEIESRQID
ncbi:MAG: hypothetical protein VX501_07615 [Pseudomonadota bacterium]|nr:hypothetical protein [Pseudomonadota bacterium]